MAAEPALKDVISQLERNLRAEKQALLTGDYGAVGAASAEKERLSASLDALLTHAASTAQNQVFRKHLAAIVGLAQENENLMAAAKTGVAVAQARLKDIINRQRNIGVYSENGDRPFAPGASITRQKIA